MSDDDPDRQSRPPTPTTMLKLLAGIYREADRAYGPFSCPASGECCQLAVSRREPWLWAPEWRMVLDRLERDGRTLPPPREDGACPLLDKTGRRCSIYTDRPFGCRTFFCGRVRGPAHEPLEKVVELMGKLEQLSRAVAPELDGPHSILGWFKRAREGR